MLETVYRGTTLLSAKAGSYSANSNYRFLPQFVFLRNHCNRRTWLYHKIWEQKHLIQSAPCLTSSFTNTQVAARVNHLPITVSKLAWYKIGTKAKHIYPDNTRAPSESARASRYSTTDGPFAPPSLTWLWSVACINCRTTLTSEKWAFAGVNPWVAQKQCIDTALMIIPNLCELTSVRHQRDDPFWGAKNEKSFIIVSHTKSSNPGLAKSNCKSSWLAEALCGSPISSSTWFVLTASGIDPCMSVFLTSGCDSCARDGCFCCVPNCPGAGLFSALIRLSYPDCMLLSTTP